MRGGQKENSHGFSPYFFVNRNEPKPVILLCGQHGRRGASRGLIVTKRFPRAPVQGALASHSLSSVSGEQG